MRIKLGPFEFEIGLLELVVLITGVVLIILAITKVMGAS